MTSTVPHHHWVVFSPSEKGHLAPLLPLISEARRHTDVPIKVTVVILLWGGLSLSSFQPLLETPVYDQTLDPVAAGVGTELPDSLQLVDFHAITSYRWQGSPHPEMNVPTTLHASADVIEYLRQMPLKPTALIYDPFVPSALIAARALNLPIISSISFSPFASSIDNWYDLRGMPFFHFFFFIQFPHFILFPFLFCCFVSFFRY